MDVYKLTDELEQLIEAGARVPLTNKVMLDERQVLDFIDRIRLSIPGDMQEAKGILEKKDGILRAAHLEAQKITATAQHEVEMKIEGTDIVALAHQKAEDYLEDAKEKANLLLREAEEEAEQRKSEADKYALEVLKGLDSQFTSMMTSIRKGIEALESEDKKV